MAIFGKKKDDGDKAAEKAPKAKAGGFAPDPAKAASWFKHASVSHQSTNYEYAMTCWLKGLAFDPANREALENYYKSAQAFAAGRPKPGPTKEQIKNVDGKGPISKYQMALLQWGGKPLDAALATKAVEAASTLQLREIAAWLGEFAIRAAHICQTPPSLITDPPHELRFCPRSSWGEKPYFARSTGSRSSV